MEFSVGQKRPASEMDSLDDGGTGKRHRPTKVLHCRNLPPQCTDAELRSLGARSGNVTGTLVLRGKNQAFIELETEEQAMMVLQKYTRIPPIIRGKTVYLQYSNRNEITHPDSDQETGPVLLVTISNVNYPITVETIFTIFSRYGQVFKTIIFTKPPGDQLQALVQLSSPQAAQLAKTELDGQYIYSGCCNMSIQFSQTKNLIVKFNNEKSRDFTNPHLPPSLDAASGHHPHHMDPSYMGQMGFPMAMQMPGQMGPQPGMASPMDPYGMSAWPGMHHQPNPFAAPTHGHAHGHSNFPSYPAAAAAPAGNAPANSSLVIINGIDERTTIDELWTLFGVYGDVMRIKIMYGKKDTALLQYQTPQQAALAISYYNNLQFRDSILRVNFSKCASIQLPRLGTENMDSTKDYADSPLHRFNGKTAQNLFPPSSCLFVNGVLNTTDREELIKLFADFGRVSDVELLSDKSAAFVQMGSLPEALEALINLHNHTFASRRLKISFAKSLLRSSSANTVASLTSSSSSAPPTDSQSPPPASSPEA
eukprot:TRINITY_DN2414_c0_g2_i1.p1 TRINITY_DN2414_c0_g2~~TRINITY_DN2414_c0_g2_i1.p1  ORF type:complete len:549 (+),score=249.44 TRINITY_DN2414_c0_g2_i1:40-1647(+)